MSVLSASDVTQFMERGWCVLNGAFTAEQARAARSVVWRRMERKRGIRETDPSTWPPAYDIEEVLTEPEVIGQLLGPDGEVISEMFDREVGTFGFTKDPWSNTWRY